MAIQFSALYSGIESFIGRSDGAALAYTYIQLAEAEIYRRVRIFEMEADLTLVLTSAENYEYTLPEDWIQFRYLYVAESRNPTTLYVSPDIFHTISNTSRDGFSRLVGEASLVYTIESGKLKVFGGVGSTDPITLNTGYWKKYAFQGDYAQETCPVLTHQFDVYLWASLMNAWIYFDEDSEIQKYERLLNRAIDQIPANEARRRVASGQGVRRFTSNTGRVV